MSHIRISLKIDLLSPLVVLRLLVLLQLFLSLENLLAWLALVNNFTQLALALRLLLQDSLLLFENFFRNRLKVSHASLRVVNMILTRQMHLVLHNALELNPASTADNLLIVLHSINHCFLFAGLGIYHHI